MAVVPDSSLFVPFTQTFVQTSGSQTSTVEYTLVGQVLDNGQTNWVGYDDGSADYLYTGSVANAQQTTLAGEVYYVSSGSAPAGYIATAAGDNSASTTQSSGSQSSSSSMSKSSDSSTSDSSSSSPTTSEGASNTGSGASSQTSQPNNSHRMSAGAAFALAVGLLAVIAL